MVGDQVQAVLAMTLLCTCTGVGASQQPHMEAPADVPESQDPKLLSKYARAQARRMAMEAHRDDQAHAVRPKQPPEFLRPPGEEGPAGRRANYIIYQPGGYNGNFFCQDRLTKCARYAGLGFCNHTNFKYYMHSNCMQTCGRCKCVSWMTPEIGEPSPTASCYSCCSTDAECPQTGTWGAERCTMSDPRPWYPVNGKTTSYLFDVVGGPTWEITGHPYWRVKHREVITSIPTVTGERVNESPVPRRGTGMLYIKGNFWMFGGLGMVPVKLPGSYPDAEAPVYTEESGVTTLTTIEYLNDQWTYDPVSMLWIRHWAKSTRPTHRAYHTMVGLEDTIIIYGGFSPFCYEYCKDAWMFNITRNEWESDRYERSHTDDKIHGEKYWVFQEDQQSGKFVTQEGYRTENEIAITNNKGETIRYDNLGCDRNHPWCIPTRRFQHVAVAYRTPQVTRDQTIQVPGYCTNLSHIESFSQTYDAVSGNITNHTVYGNYSCLVDVIEQQTVPSKRIMIIHGGFGGARKGNYATIAKLVGYQSDTWKYDLDSLKWEKMNPWAANDNVGPGARRDHSAVLFNGSMYIFGGRIPESVLTRAGALPRTIHKPCATHAQWTSSDGQRQPWAQERVINENLFCIDDYDLVKNDVWRYDIMNNSWHEILPAPESPIPVGRHGQKTVVWDDMVYMFGGYYDPIRYLDDTWHFNITARMWHNKYIGGQGPSPRAGYGLAINDRLIIIFSGYGARCDMVRDPSTTAANDNQPPTDDFEGVVSSGWHCEPNGTAYYPDDTWHHDLSVCPNDCFSKGSCHYGSCICDYRFHGRDCSNFTCPDCITMADHYQKICHPLDAQCTQAMACEIYNSEDIPMTVSPADLVHQLSWTNTSTAPEHQPPFERYTLSSGTSLDNCYYNFSLQAKICRSCSETSHGTCDYFTGNCMCDAKFSNFDCSYEACPHPTCNGGGTCLLSGKCLCYYAYFGDDCSINFACPNQCSFQGICEINGTCVCYEAFMGVDCSIEITVSGTGYPQPAMTTLLVALLLQLFYLKGHN